MTAVRALRIAALVEAASLAVLLVNLVTVHLGAISSATGPLHGTAYLAVIVLTLMTPPPSGRWWSLVPGIGGLLVLRKFPDPREAAEGQPS
ncbi:MULTISPECIES: DUF3817 domain-containing protein [Actinomadura]|uniref:DUF3817 domain-containing protein n=1 Tax=Actinomadura TaxID=1988 RepID=UPI001BE472E8|nr:MULTISPECIES: DUF3817 domain-containing protein [Actinomadura]MBT2211710.1 hypothetical protein [Actinomadura sp. NEAU-AAG7]